MSAGKAKGERMNPLPIPESRGRERGEGFPSLLQGHAPEDGRSDSIQRDGGRGRGTPGGGRTPAVLRGEGCRCGSFVDLRIPPYPFSGACS